MNPPKVTYLDVGCWQSYENEDPKMTFALIEHNTIALCTYYSNGKRLISLPIKTKEYDFEKTLVFRFLNGLLRKKYEPICGPGASQIGPWVSLSKHPSIYHIQKIITFPTQTLLDKEDELLIFIPDIHLHYFKMSYLDNFITYFKNDWDPESARPIKKPIKRTSMEYDFSTFLEYIAEFQKSDHILTKVFILGDLTEMWETRASIESFIILNPNNIKKNLSTIYKGLDSLAEWVYRHVKAKGDLARLLKDVRNLKISRLPFDSVFENQITSLRKDERTVEKLYISEYESSDSIEAKARYLEDEILKKYTNKQGKHFGELFSDITSKYRIHGNHDNFRKIHSLTPIYTFMLYGMDSYLQESWKKILPDEYPSKIENAKTSIFIMHGHNLELFNNDEFCGIGYFLVNLLSFFEAKKRGDLLKRIESVITGGAHQDLIKSISILLFNWEKGKKERLKKNKVIVHAHTHVPLLEDITEHYNKYKRIEIKKAQEKTITYSWFDRLAKFLCYKACED